MSLNTETQIEQPATAEKPPESESSESTPIKKQHGGRRPGAGRKRDVVGRLVSSLKRTTAAEILEGVNPEKVIREIFQKGSLTLKQRTLADLWDRAFGRPAQNVNLAGSVVHWTPELLAHLTDEDMAVLAKISRMQTAPVLPESTDNQGRNRGIKPAIDAQDAPGFQVNSTTAIEAGQVESEAGGDAQSRG